MSKKKKPKPGETFTATLSEVMEMFPVQPPEVVVAYAPGAEQVVRDVYKIPKGMTGDQAEAHVLEAYDADDPEEYLGKLGFESLGFLHVEVIV